MVDRAEIERALSHICERAMADAQKRGLAVDTKFNRAGRFRSGSHIQAFVEAMTEVNATNLSDMSEKVRHYAGADAEKHVDLLGEAGTGLATRLKGEVNKRLRDAIPSDQRQELLHGLEASLTAARDAAIRDLKHGLADPEDALPWWRRTRTKDHAVGFILGVISSLVVAWLTKLAGLSQ